MGHVLDLSNSHFTDNAGDMVVIGTWLGESVEDSEPCLVIMPRYRSGVHEHIKPAVIALSSAYKYDDPKYLLSAAMHFNQAMDRGDSMQNVHRLADAIYDHIGDLVSMPPRPVREKRIGADAFLTNEDGSTLELEIPDNV